MGSLFKAHLFSSVAAEVLATKNTAADNITEKRIFVVYQIFLRKKKEKEKRKKNEGKQFVLILNGLRFYMKKKKGINDFLV